MRCRIERQSVGCRVLDLSLSDERLAGITGQHGWSVRLKGREISSVSRRGKYLLIWVDQEHVLLSHPRMTGNWLTSAEPSLPYARASLKLDSGQYLLYADVRRFGTWAWLSGSAADAYLDCRLGPEPISDAFTWRHLQMCFARRSVPVKAVLLDQRIAAGVGNIYADEALHRAGIHPKKVASSLRPQRLKRLADALCSSLKEGIEQQNRLVIDPHALAGSYGGDARILRVHGRKGQSCDVCGARIIKQIVAGRGTYYCPGCQRM